MDIERILQLGKQFEGSPTEDMDVLGMIISNRIDIYIGEQHLAAVSGKRFAQLAEDILTWHKSKLSGSMTRDNNNVYPIKTKKTLD